MNTVTGPVKFELIPDTDPIEAAVAAYRNRTPDSIKVFRELTDDQAAVVIRVLKMTARGPKKPKDTYASVMADALEKQGS